LSFLWENDKVGSLNLTGEEKMSTIMMEEALSSIWKQWLHDNKVFTVRTYEFGLEIASDNIEYWSLQNVAKLYNEVLRNEH
jgi:hypothetical protein